MKKHWPWIVFPLLLAGTLSLWVFWRSLGPCFFGVPAPNSANAFGDTYGALAALFTALAFWGLLMTIVLQGRELKETTREMAKQVEATEASARVQHYISLTALLQDPIRSEALLYCYERTSVDEAVDQVLSEEMLHEDSEEYAIVEHDARKAARAHDNRMKHVVVEALQTAAVAYYSELLDAQRFREGFSQAFIVCGGFCQNFILNRQKAWNPTPYKELVRAINEFAGQEIIGDVDEHKHSPD